MLCAFMLTAALAADPATRLTESEAGAKVAEFVRKEKPKAVVPPILKVTDLTTDNVWKKLKVQVVRIQPDELAGGEAFLLQGDRVRPIGESFGGEGVTSLAVLEAGERPILVYAFAWGSGEHRSQLAALDVSDPKAEEISLLPANFSDRDFNVRNTADGAVAVSASRIHVGHILAERRNGSLQVRFNLTKDQLPRDLRESLR